jgi:trans-2-enoyl-CoA reductase
MCLGFISREFLFTGAGGQDFFRLFRRELADLTRAHRFADCLRKPEHAGARTLMNKSINAAVYERHGNPADVLRVESRPWPTAAAHEVVVEMRAAPINPADLNQIEGKYPVRRELPTTPGFEGAGVVVDAGANVSTIPAGTLVILPHNLGTWREAVAVKASELVAVPPGIEPLHAAMLKINPMTAWRLLHDYIDLKKGDWLIQNAANSAAGRAVIQIAHELGYRTVNIVRRSELIDELRSEGGDVVFVDGENLREDVKNATGDAPIRLGLNAVGGDSALRLANCLAPGSTLVTFGAMSLQPLKIPNGLLIFKDLRFRGIWINKWYDNATMEERMDAFRQLFEMAKRGLLKTKVEKSYPLSEAKAAVAHAAHGKRSGKIIFEFDD